MTINSAAREKFQSALGALTSGHCALPTFEGLIADMIGAEILTAADARVEVEAAIKTGALKPDSLLRLGLMRAPARDQTQIRAFATAPPVSGLPVGSPTDFRGSTADTDWEADWPEEDSADSDSSARVGTLLGNRYRLDFKIGEGGMGVVYRATDVEVNGEMFAIKVLKPAIQKRPEALKLVREEVRKTRALRHPNIVGVYSLNSDPTGAYMLMEYLEGKSVSALMNEEFGRGMPLIRAWPLIQDIGSALAYAHDHNVIHSDLKPSNLFVTVSGKAMLLDFGIARAVRVRAGRFDTGSMGALTPAYASSEMTAGHSPDQSDDVYAFACVIHEMLSGKHPFNSLGAEDAQRMGMRPPPLSCLDKRQNQALARALAFDRAQRTSSVEALLSALAGSRRSQGRWPPWLGIGTAVCLVAGVAAYAVLHRTSPERSAIRIVPAPAAAPASKTPPVPAATGALIQSPGGSAAIEPPLPASGDSMPIAPATTPAVALGTTETAPVVSTPRTASPSITELKPPGAAAAALPGQSVSPVQAPSTTPTASMTSPDTGGTPPLGKKVQAIVPSADAAEGLASCAYPEDARSKMETGTVVVIVYVLPSGTPANALVDTTSGSASLDQAAINCVMQHGRFAARAGTGGKHSGYWGRMKFNWSFGD